MGAQLAVQDFKLAFNRACKLHFWVCAQLWEEERKMGGEGSEYIQSPG